MRIIILTGLLILNFSITFAQTEIRGVIIDSDDNSPILGASIIEVNTNNGVISDHSGQFKIIVNDTSKIRVSYIGYDDYIITPQDFKKDTIRISISLLSFSTVTYYQTFRIGYYGDFNYLPFGITTYYYRPYLFGQRIRLSTQIDYKTNFDSNYDLKLNLDKEGIIEFRKYQMSVSLSYQKRELKDIDIRDYEIITNNYILNKYSTKIGLALKDGLNSDNVLNKGVIIGLSKYVGKTLTFLDGDVAIYNGFSEFNVSIFQGISDYKRFWSNLKLGIDYRYYKDYDEFNLILRYDYSF